MRTKSIILHLLASAAVIGGSVNLSYAQDSAPVTKLVAKAAPQAGGASSQATGLQWESFPTLAEQSIYKANFPHFDYVNPNAPKGGTLNMVAIGTFDSLNPYIVAGLPAEGLKPLRGGLLYETLLTASVEEASGAYRGIASAMMSPPDASWVSFKIDPKARWHDGTPITAEDIIWSFGIIHKYSPFYRGYYDAVDHVETPSPDVVKFVFKHPGDREMPMVVGDLPILPKHWWLGKDKNGKQRDITKPTLEIPLGSGAYRIASIIPAKQVIWERVPDYWGKDLPYNVGRNNFDKIVYNYMRDENSAWEAFKKGGIVDFRQEKDIHRWLHEYNFSAVQNGSVAKVSFPNINSEFYAYHLNTRRAKFADRRVRKALFLALDFDTMNRTLFHNKFVRVLDYYNYPVLRTHGLPQGREKEILETVRSIVPHEVFDAEFTAPVYKTPQDTRKHLDEAMALLREAGWVLKDGHLVDKSGNPFTMEFLLSTPINEQFTSFYATNLRKLGIEVSIRTVDNTQYMNRRSTQDFDVVYENVPESNSPGNEQLDFFGSALARANGTMNYSGIQDPAVDKIIDVLIHEKTREGVVAATKALDRVLSWNYYMIPTWIQKNINVAYWKKIALPPKQPQYIGFDFLSAWVNPEVKSPDAS